MVSLLLLLAVAVTATTGTLGKVAAKVLMIRHDYQKEQWKAIARVLLYGYCREGIFPICLSAVFITSCILGEDSISDEMLLKALTAYVSEDEKELINDCLENRVNIDQNDELYWNF